MRCTVDNDSTENSKKVTDMFYLQHSPYRLQSYDNWYLINMMFMSVKLYI